MFSTGLTLSSFKVGDKVTVRYTSDRPIYHQGSHATVVTVGTKRVHVRMDKAAFEHHDGAVANFLPGDLERGHVGTPRSWDRVADAVTTMQLDTGAQVVSVAVESGVITAEQGERIEALWANHVRGQSAR